MKEIKRIKANYAMGILFTKMIIFTPKSPTMKAYGLQESLNKLYKLAT